MKKKKCNYSTCKMKQRSVFVDNKEQNRPFVRQVNSVRIKSLPVLRRFVYVSMETVFRHQLRENITNRTELIST